MRMYGGSSSGSVTAAILRALGIRMFLDAVEASTTIYVATTGNDSTGDGSIGSPFLTIEKAVSARPWIMGFLGQRTIQLGSGTFTMPGNLYGGNRVLIQGATPTTTSYTSGAGTGGTISAGAKLVVAAAPFVAGAQVGNIVKMTSGALNGTKGVVYANNTTTLWVTWAHSLTTFPVATSGDTFDVLTQLSTIQVTGGGSTVPPILTANAAIRFQDITFTGATANQDLIVSGSFQVRFDACRFVSPFLRSLVAQDGGAIFLSACYVKTIGTAFGREGMVSVRPLGGLRLSSGNVFDGSASAAGGGLLRFAPGSAVTSSFDQVFVNMDDEAAVLIEGSVCVSPIAGFITNRNWRFVTCNNGVVVNNTTISGGTVGGDLHIPQIHDTDGSFAAITVGHAIAARGGSKIRVDAGSSVVTGYGTNTVSADGGSSICAYAGDGTKIESTDLLPALASNLALPSTKFIFAPNGGMPSTAGLNVYTDFSVLAADVARTTGPKVVTFFGGGADITLPVITGVAMGDCKWEALRFQATGGFSPPYDTKVIFPEGFTFAANGDPLSYGTGLYIVNQASATSPVTVNTAGNGSGRYFHTGAFFLQDGDAPFFSVGANGVIFIVIDRACTIEDNSGHPTHGLIHAANAAATIQLICDGDLGNNSVSGVAGSSILVEFGANGNLHETQTGMLGTIVSQPKGYATSVRYDTTTSGLTATTVQAAIDETLEQVPGFIHGLALSYTSAASVTIAAGTARDSTNTQTITLGSTQVVSLAASGANGLDTGAEASNTWYYVYVIRGVSGVAGLISASSSAPTLPAGYTYFRRVGTFRNNGSSNIINFTCFGDSLRYFYYVEDLENLRALSNGVAAAYTAVSCASFVPPTAVDASLDCIVGVVTSGNQFDIRTTGTSVSRSRTVALDNVFWLVLDGSQQFDYKQTAGTGQLFVDVQGWRESL